MSYIELIMEVNSSLSEILLNFGVKSQGSFNDWHNLLLNGSLEFVEMLLQECVVNSEQRSLLWEGNSESPEMSLKSRVDLERTSSGIHTGSVLSVLNIFQ